MFLTIAVHHVVPEHRAAFLDHMRRVIRATTGAEGLVDFDCYEADGGDLLGVARWTDRAAFEAALPRIGSLRDRRDPEWTRAEDELITATRV